MIKTLVTFILLIFIHRTAYSKADTVWYYMKTVSEIYDINHYDTGAPVATKESATFIRSVISPDYAVDSLYRINDYYLNGKLKFTAKSKSSNYEVQLEGTSVEYFTNGRRKRIGTFHNGKPDGDILEYFPNGRLNTIKTIDSQSVVFFKQCLDSTGNVLAEDGTGKWIEYQSNYKIPFAEGAVANGLEDGEWHGQINDTAKYICKYEKGGLIEGKSISNSGREYPFKSILTIPEFKGGLNKFGAFLARTLRYPVDAREKKKQGRVIMGFVVNSDGTLSNIRVIRGVWPSIDNEALNAMVQTPNWVPCYKFGIASSVSYAVPISFTLAYDK